MVTVMLVVRNRKSMEMERWWKRWMEAQVKQLNKDLGHINTLIERKIIKKKRKDGLERRYKMKWRGFPVTREEIKENFKAKNNKIKRYQSRINQHQQNRTFKNNQWKFYRELKQWRKELWNNKFLTRKRHKNFGRVSGEKENTRKMSNNLKISRGTLNTKRNKKK